MSTVFLYFAGDPSATSHPVGQNIALFIGGARTSTSYRDLEGVVIAGVAMLHGAQLEKGDVPKLPQVWLGNGGRPHTAVEKGDVLLSGWPPFVTTRLGRETVTGRQPKELGHTLGRQWRPHRGAGPLRAWVDG